MSLSQSFSQKIGNVRPLNPCPSLDIDFANGGYVNTGGFANQESVGSANFKIGAFNGPDPIFTRSSAATFRGSNGLIQYAPENLLSYSEQFDNPYWTKFGATVTPNNAIGPDGLQTADRVVFGAANKEVRRLVSVSGTTTASIYIKGTAGETIAWSNAGVSPAVDVIHTLSGGWDRVVFTTTATNPYVSVNTYSSVTARTIYIWGAQIERSSTARPYISTTALPVYGPRFEYDLNGNPLGLLMEEQSTNLVYPSSTLTTQTRTVTAAPHTLSFYGTGSVSLSGATTGTVIGSGANTRTVYTFTPTAGSLTLTVSGSVTSAQLEQKPFATSYIPTVSGSVTRNADVVSSTIGSWYNADEGTIVVKGDRTGFNIQDSLFEFTSGTTASLAHRGDGTDENFLVEDAGTTVTIVETIPLNSPLYFAASYSDPATQVNATVNAEPVQGTTLASTITTPTTLNIGYSPEISTYFNGHIKAFRYYAKDWPSKLEFFTLTA